MAKIDPVIFDMTRKLREVIRAINDLEDSVTNVTEIVQQVSDIPVPLPSAWLVGNYPGITGVGELTSPLTSSWWAHRSTLVQAATLAAGFATVMAGPLTIASGVVITVNGTMVIV